jgi:hypothetical protein
VEVSGRVRVGNVLYYVRLNDVLMVSLRERGIKSFFVLK